MKKLRFFDSLKFVVAAIVCTLILNIAHADIPTGYTQITSSDTTNYPNTLTGYTKYTITNASWQYIGGSNGGEAYIRYQISPENIVGDGAQISNMFKKAGVASSNEVIGFMFYYSTSNRKTFVSVRDSSKFTTDASAQTYFTAHPLIILVKTTTPTDNVYQLVKRDSDGVIGYYCTVGTNAGDFVPAFGATDINTIKIATTKYNEEQFEPVKTDLSAAVNAVEYVVSNTMSQAQAIDQIATSKQTRPDEGCPAKYCLLVEDEDGTPHWYPIAGANGVAHNLPDGYTELQYIESTGTQYINTGIYGRAGLSVDMVVQGTGDKGIIFSFDQDYTGSYVGDSGTDFRGPSTFTGISSLVKTDITTYWESENSKLKQTTTINGVTKTSSMYSRTPLVIELFKGAAWNTADSFWAGKIFSFLLKRNGVAIRNFIPAKNSNNEIGLYDMVSGQFFTNAGTGDFTAGPDM